MFVHVFVFGFDELIEELDREFALIVAGINPVHESPWLVV